LEGGATSDPWQAKRSSSGALTLKNRHTKLCLQDLNGQAVAATCSSSQSQRWEQIAVAQGIYMLRNVQSRRCLHSHLDVASGRPHMYGCNTAWWSTHWESTSVGSGHVQLRGRHTGVCLGSHWTYQNRLNGSTCNSGWWSQHWERRSSQQEPPAPSGPIPGGLLSLDFDDNCDSHYTVAAPLMEQRGIRGTFYLLSASSILDQGHINLPDGGHEVGAHTIDHPDLTTLGQSEVIRQLDQSKNDLAQAIGVSINGFASPFGRYNSQTVSLIRPRFRFHRTTDWGLNYPGSDAYRLRCHSIPRSYTVSKIRSLIDEAKNKGGWQILLFHCLGNKSDEYSVSRFQQVLSYVKSSGIRVVTASEGVKVLRN
jgi:peptidoglycan/xylan/chitin deacetylase (PgdA/CDA1 family)